MQITTIIGIVLVGLVLTGMAATCIGNAAFDAVDATNAHSQAIVDALATQ